MKTKTLCSKSFQSNHLIIVKYAIKDLIRPRRRGLRFVEKETSIRDDTCKFCSYCDLLHHGADASDTNPSKQRCASSFAYIITY